MCLCVCVLVLTEAAENIIEVVEIVVAFLQDRLVAHGDIDLSVGVCYRAGAAGGIEPRVS